MYLKINPAFLLLVFFLNSGCTQYDADTVPNDTDSIADPDTSTDTDSVATLLNGTYIQSVKQIKTWSLSEVETLFSLLQLQIPAAASLPPKLQSGVDVYKITYLTNYQTALVPASALLAIPHLDSPLPVFSFQNGTNTEYSAAPTEDIVGEFMFTRIISSVAAMGYVVVIADYLGFGESTQLFHPYLCKDVTASTLADLLRATVELEETATIPFELTGDLFLTGYSQGGHATMALAEYLETQPDFPLVHQATAAGAGPYNLTTTNDYVLSMAEYEQPYYGPYTVLAFQSLGFIENNLSLYFAAPFAQSIPQLFNGMHHSDQINASLTTTISQLYAPGYLAGIATDDAYAPLRAAFAHNSIKPFPSQVPLRLYHGNADTYIPVDSTIALYNTLLEANSKVGNTNTQIEYVALEGDHETAGPAAIINAVEWFNELNGY